MEKELQILERMQKDEPIIYKGGLFFPYCMYATCFFASSIKTDVHNEIEISFGGDFESDGNYFFNEALFSLFSTLEGGSFVAEGFLEGDYSLIYVYEDGSESVFLYSDEQVYLHDISILEKVYKITVFNDYKDTQTSI